MTLICTSGDGNNILAHACEYRDALAAALILVRCRAACHRFAMVSHRNAKGKNAACYIHDLEPEDPLAVLLKQEVQTYGMDAGDTMPRRNSIGHRVYAGAAAAAGRASTAVKKEGVRLAQKKRPSFIVRYATKKEEVGVRYAT